MSSTPDATTNKVRVVGRIRPLAKYEIKNGSKRVVTKVPGSMGSSETLAIEDETGAGGGNDKNRWFELDAVLDDTSSQKEVYEKSGARKAISEDLFSGYNTTILAYGQTGSGKTYSMGSAPSCDKDKNGETIVDDVNDGVIPRSCRDLFESIRSKCDGQATVQCSYMEVYNEEIRDLLVEPAKGKSGKQQQQQLRIRETLDGQIYVRGLTEREVKSPVEIYKIMEEANGRRVVASTKMNATSSRSHAICVLRIKGVVVFSENGNNDDGVSTKFESKLTLVDLAGSEKLGKTGATGKRAKEGISINKGLFVLGQVVSALAERGRILNEIENAKKAMKNGGKKRKILAPRKPPYRDSKLTRLLQDSLGGNSRTIMIACVSPADFNVEETVNTLRYATQARNISNTATANLVATISQDEARKLKRENAMLKDQIKELESTITKLTQDVSPDDLQRSISMIQHEQQNHSYKKDGPLTRPRRARQSLMEATFSDDADLHETSSREGSTHGVSDNKEVADGDSDGGVKEKDTNAASLDGSITSSSIQKPKKKGNMSLDDHFERSRHDCSNEEEDYEDYSEDKDSVSLLADDIFETRSTRSAKVAREKRTDQSSIVSRTIEELEDENVELEARLILAERDVKATVRSAAEVPALKNRVKQLEEDINESKWLENAAWELQQQLEEAKSDKESAQRAAQQLTEFMNQQKKETGFSGNELKMERVNYFRHKLNEDWVRFIVIVLNSFKEEMRLLGDYFHMVTQVIESPDILGMLGMLDNKSRQSTISNAGVGWWKSQEQKETELKAVQAEKNLRNDLLNEHILFFNDRLVEMEEEVNFRSESIDVILEGLSNERTILEAECKGEPLDSKQDVFSKKGEKLLNQLEILMGGKLFNTPIKLPGT